MGCRMTTSWITENGSSDRFLRCPSFYCKSRGTATIPRVFIVQLNY